MRRTALAAFARALAPTARPASRATVVPATPPVLSTRPGRAYARGDDASSTTTTTTGDDASTVADDVTDARLARASAESTTSSSSARGGGESTRPARLRRDRLYYPGQTYSPGDLAPLTERSAPVTHTAAGKTVKNPMRGKAAETSLLRRANAEDARFLTQFVSDTGKIYPKRRLGVSAKAQRKIAKAIKTARQMGILPYTSRLPQFQRARENS
jgi:small subunit ribosomal protein S18